MNLFVVDKGHVGKINGFVFCPEVMGCEFSFSDYDTDLLELFGIKEGKEVSLRAKGTVKCFDGRRSVVEITFSGCWNTACDGDPETVNIALNHYQLSLVKQGPKPSIKE